VVPEAIEGSLMLASHALALVGVPMRRVIRLTRDARDKRYGLLRGYFHGQDDDDGGRTLEQARLAEREPASCAAAAVGRALGALALPMMGVQVVSRAHRLGAAPSAPTRPWCWPAATRWLLRLARSLVPGRSQTAEGRTMPPRRRILFNQNRRRCRAWGMVTGAALAAGWPAAAQDLRPDARRGVAVLVRVMPPPSPASATHPATAWMTAAPSANSAPPARCRHAPRDDPGPGRLGCPPRCGPAIGARCIDTARLAFGQASPWQPLDSFFDQPQREAAQTAALRAALAALPAGKVVVWVTHQVNISALTGEPTGFAEAVVVQAGDTGAAPPRVLARLRTPG